MLELKYNMLFVVLDVNLGNLNYLVVLHPIEGEKSIIKSVNKNKKKNLIKSNDFISSININNSLY